MNFLFKVLLGIFTLTCYQQGVAFSQSSGDNEDLPGVIHRIIDEAPSCLVPELRAANIIHIGEARLLSISFEPGNVPTSIQLSSQSNTGLGSVLHLGREQSGFLFDNFMSNEQIIVEFESCAGVQKVVVTPESASSTSLSVTDDFLNMLATTEEGDDLLPFIGRYASIDRGLALSFIQTHFNQGSPLSEELRFADLGNLLNNKPSKGFLEARADHPCLCTALNVNVTVSPSSGISGNPNVIQASYDSDVYDWGNVEGVRDYSYEGAAMYVKATTDASSCSNSEAVDYSNRSQGSGFAPRYRQRFRLQCTRNGAVNGTYCGCSKIIDVNYEAHAEQSLDGEKENGNFCNERVRVGSFADAELVVSRQNGTTEVLDAGATAYEMRCNTSWNFEDALLAGLELAGSIFVASNVENTGATPAQIQAQIEEILEDIESAVGVWEDIVTRTGCQRIERYDVLLDGSRQVTLNSNENLSIVLTMGSQVFSGGFGKWNSSSVVLTGAYLVTVVGASGSGGSECCSDRRGAWAYNAILGMPVTDHNFRTEVGSVLGLYSPEWDNLTRFPNSFVDDVPDEVSAPQVAMYEKNCSIEIEAPGEVVGRSISPESNPKLMHEGSTLPIEGTLWSSINGEVIFSSRSHVGELILFDGFGRKLSSIQTKKIREIVTFPNYNLLRSPNRVYAVFVTKDGSATYQTLKQ